MADTTVDSDAESSLDEVTNQWGPYWSDVSKGAILSIEGALAATDEDACVWRTTDKGASWSKTELIATTNIEGIAAWFDKETPGDTGTVLHCLYSSSAGGAGACSLFYRTIDVDDGTLGTQRTIVSNATIANVEEENRIMITKTRSGNLLVALVTASESICYRSTDGGVNWTSRAVPFETHTVPTDFALMFPANTGDDDDAGCVYWDVSASALSVKMYDNSADSWTETAISGTFTSDPEWSNMDLAVRHSDGHVLLAVHSAYNSASDNFLTYDINPNSIASPGVTAKTNIFSSQANSIQAAILINQQNDDVYVAYIKGGTITATADVVYHKSTDDMGTWGTEQAYSEGTADDLRSVSSGRTISSAGGRWQPTFFNDDLDDLFVNETNDVEVAADTGVALTGSLPAMSGRLLNSKRQIDGNLPAMSGRLLNSKRPVHGSLPAQSGVLTDRTIVALTGSLPAMSGVLVSDAGAISIAGSLPAMSGVLSLHAYIAEAGSLPAMSGRLLNSKRPLHGSLPAMSGALVPVQVTFVPLTGSLPSMSGALSLNAFLNKAGSLPAMSGVLSLHAYISEAGSLPAMSGVLSLQVTKGLLGDLPAQSGRLLTTKLTLRGDLPEMSGRILVSKIPLVGDLPAASGVLVSRVWSSTTYKTLYLAVDNSKTIYLLSSGSGFV